jgi:hypothetical protein
VARREGGEVTWIGGCLGTSYREDSGGMSKHGFWIEGKRGVAREDGVSEVFRGTDKGSTQLSSSLGNEEVLLMAEEVAVGSLKMGV